MVDKKDGSNVGPITVARMGKGTERLRQTWQVAAWEIQQLEFFVLGKIPFGSSRFGKIPYTIKNTAIDMIHNNCGVYT